MRMPNFFIIGAAKSGTTSLYRLLEQHPDVYMSHEKEPRFFALDGAPLDFCGPGDEHSNVTAVYEPEAYLRLFSGVSTQRAVGEASTLYMFSPIAPLRIKAAVPEARFIAILRHPVERAYSNYLHLVRDGRETSSFAEALRLEEHRTSVLHWSRFWYYKQTGFYYEQLKRYYDLFDPGQIRVYLYEDLRSDPVALAKDAFRFLEIDDTFTPTIPADHNVSGIPKNKFTYHLLFKQNTPLKAALKSIKPLLPAGVKNKINQVKRRNLTKPALPSQVREDLLMAYREDIMKLQNIVQRDLSGWLA